jgi:predicted RNA-binding protein YlqC (UPF0109 family)
MSTEQTSLVPLVEMMVRSIVDHPAEVVVKETAGDTNVILEVYVNDRDIGYCLGRDGKTVSAMRTIMSAAAKKLGINYLFDIRIPGQPPRRQ